MWAMGTSGEKMVWISPLTSQSRNTIGEEANHTDLGHINPKPVYTVTVTPTALFHAVTPITPPTGEEEEEEQQQQESLHPLRQRKNSIKITSYHLP